LVGFMEAISIAKAMAAKTRQEISPNQEFIAVGAANAAAGLFQAFPVAGGFSRTAVNYQAGAQTGMATLVTAATVAISVLLLTPLLFDLPKAILAAIIVVAVAGLVDTRAARNIFRVRITDDGPGIDPAIQHQLFDPRFTTKHGRVSFGSGLGLSICRQIADAHHGTIELSSDGRGTVATVVLPVDSTFDTREATA